MSRAIIIVAIILPATMVPVMQVYAGAPAAVYVDDDFAGLPKGSDPPGPGTAIGVDAFATGFTLDGGAFLIYQAIRHKGTGDIDHVRFVNIIHNVFEPIDAGTAIAAFGGVGPVNVSHCHFSNIGVNGVYYFGLGTTGAFNANVYIGKGPGDFTDWGVQVGAGASVSIFENAITNNLGTGDHSAGVVATTYLGSGTAVDIRDNSITNNVYGLVIGSHPQHADQTRARVEGNDLTGNTTTGLVVFDGATVDAGNCAGADITGFGASQGANDLSGYDFGNKGPFAIMNLNEAIPYHHPVVRAENNDFGATPSMNIEDVIYDDSDSQRLTQVLFSQNCCPADINVDGAIDVNDLLAVVGAWGHLGFHPADVNHDLVVNVNDLLVVVGAWGPCG